MLLTVSMVVLTDPDAKQFVSGVSKVMAYLVARDPRAHGASTPTNPAHRPGLRQRQKTLTADETEQVIAKYTSGATIVELAKEYQCHRTTVSKKLTDAGVEIREKAPTEQQIDEMVQLYTSGLSLARVGYRVGVSPNTVLKYLRARGTEIRRGPGPTPRIDHPPPARNKHPGRVRQTEISSNPSAAT